MLDGQKTYIAGTLVAFVAFAGQVGWLTPEAADLLRDMLLGGGLIALRSGIKKDTAWGK